MKNKLLTSGLLAGLVAGAGAGLVLETSGFAGAAAPVVVSQDDGTDTTVPGTDQDTDQGRDGRAAERSARITEALQPLVDDGILTVAQRDAVVAALEAAAPLGGHGGHGGRGGHGMRGEGLEAAAEALGMTTDELRTELRDGATIAEIAAAEGVEVQSVIDAMVVAAGAHLAEHVAAGDITQEQADARLEEITARITDHVNNGGPAEGMEGRGGRGGRGHHGPDVGDSDGPDTGGADTSA